MYLLPGREQRWHADSGRVRAGEHHRGGPAVRSWQRRIGGQVGRRGSGVSAREAWGRDLRLATEDVRRRATYSAPAEPVWLTSSACGRTDAGQPQRQEGGPSRRGRSRRAPGTPRTTRPEDKQTWSRKQTPARSV